MPPKDAPTIEDNKRAGRAPGGRRPRTEPRGFLGDDDEHDPTRTTGIGLLDAADAAIQESLAGPPSVTRPLPTERPGRRPPNDDRPGGLLRPPPAPEEEEPPIIPGDPSNLGARGRRRRSENDSTASPVLRRGLLGV